MKLRFMTHKDGIVNLSEIDYLQERIRNYAGNRKVQYVNGYCGRPGGKKTLYNFGPCKIEDIVAFINGTRQKVKKVQERFTMITSDCDLDEVEVSNFCVMECETGRVAINLARIACTRVTKSGRVSYDDDDDDDDDDEDDDSNGQRRSRGTETKRAIIFKSNTSLIITKKAHDLLMSKLMRNLVDRKD